MAYLKQVIRCQVSVIFHLLYERANNTSDKEHDIFEELLVYSGYTNS